jgi:MFS family permease
VWKEPTKDQWIAWWAAWLGWTLDAFDFTIFLLIMVPIANEFNVPLTAVAIVFTLTLWLRLVGATASGWLADRVGRKIPLMISILWYSICNFIAGFSPSFMFLLFFRALLGIGMGAEWPAGASLAMEFLAGAITRFHERRAARLLGARFPAVQRGLQPVLRLHRLARHAVDRHPAGALRCVGAQIR